MNKLDSEIDTLKEEYGNKLREAYIFASDNLYFNDINLLRQLDREAKNSLFQYTRNRVRQRRIALLFTSFILISGYITAIACFYTKSPNSDFILKIAIYSTIFSIITIYASLLLHIFKRKISRSIIIKHELISTWNELENITRNLSTIKEKDCYISPKYYLTQMGILSEEEQVNIMHLLSIRNKIVHFSDEHISDQEITQVTESAKKIIEKLTNKTSK